MEIFGSFLKNNHKKYIQQSNMDIARKVSDAVRTSLGPHGMDKGILEEQKILITNDGATILKNAVFGDSAARMLVNVSITQDKEVGDGTTSIVILSSSFLGSCISLVDKKVSPVKISDNFYICLKKSQETLLRLSLPIDLHNRNILYEIAAASLESKVTSVHSYILSPIAVNSILKITDANASCDVNLKNIKIIKKLGGTIEQSELLDGVGIEYSIFKSHNGPVKIRSGKIALIQFHINLPASEAGDILVVKNYLAMDKIIKEEKQYITGICRKIKSSGCNVILLQKSIVQESICELALQILAEMKIMIIKDIEVEDLDFIINSLSCIPIVDIESMEYEKFGFAEYVEERTYGSEKLIIFEGVKNSLWKTATIIIRGSNDFIIREAERSLHDALCVIRSVIRRRYLIGGGGSAEIEISLTLKQFSKCVTGTECFCMIAFANSLEIIPYTLAENAGFEPIRIISELKKIHFFGDKLAGINVKKGIIENTFKAKIISPLLTLMSMLSISVEFIIQILKIDDIIKID